ncbi:MAG: ImmA/IrrE family metallo-endopeptidase [Clostridia bacterium]|nr:ImmA/IrrE family metallo-endopeptidase [Clostridia bacterium]
MIARNEYAVRLLDLPEGVGGFITESPDGFLNIYINARHPLDRQRRSLRHELRHAERDDLHSTEPLAIIEARADGLPAPLKAIPQLMRARDLLPVPEPKPKSNAPRLTPRQTSILMAALSELDRCYFKAEADF